MDIASIFRTPRKKNRAPIGLLCGNVELIRTAPVSSPTEHELSFFPVFCHIKSTGGEMKHPVLLRVAK